MNTETKVTIAGLQPLADRVFILPDVIADKTEAGVIIPDTAKAAQRKTGVVVAIGPGRYERGQLNPTYLKPGNKVLFNAFSGTEIEVEDKKLLLMREDDIFSIV